MSRLVVVNHLTLDGVMQAPAAPDEDRRDGFERGGWAAPNNDSVMEAVMAEGMGKRGALLLGRRTYEQFAAVWPNAPADNPYTGVINDVQKYVVSTTLREPLPWRNSTLLDGDLPAAVSRLKRQEGILTVLGSGELVQSLLRHDLIDEFVLPIHPVVLGTGHRLFPEGGAAARLRLIDVKTTTTGVVIAIYQSADGDERGR